MRRAGIVEIMNLILGVLATVMPVLGAAWVSIRAIRRDKGTSKERAFRAGLSELHNTWLEECRTAASKAPDIPETASSGYGTYYDECQKRVGERVDSVLQLGGYATQPTYADVDVDLAMSRREFSPAERRDQWLLLWSALAGVVLVALSLLVPA